MQVALAHERTAQGRKAKKPKTAAAPHGALPEAAASFVGRDQGLTLFHALGKFLYNKRLDEPGVGGAVALNPLKVCHHEEGLQRLQLSRYYTCLFGDMYMIRLPSKLRRVGMFAYISINPQRTT